MRTRNIRSRRPGLAIVGGLATGLIVAFQVLCVLVSFGLSVGVVYVAWHFIEKFW